MTNQYNPEQILGIEVEDSKLEIEAKVVSKFEEAKARLKKLGIETLISNICYGVSAHGFNYTSEEYPEGTPKFNKESVFGVIAYYHPEVQDFDSDKREKLDIAIELIAAAADIAVLRIVQFYFNQYPEL